MTKHNSRKPRDVNLYLDMGNPTVINRIGLKKDGCVVFEDIKGAVTPAAAFISNSHYRQNKPPKIINQTSLLPNRLIIDFNKALSNYTCVFAIDTNKPEKSLPNIVFTGLVHAKVQESENNILKVLIYKESVLEFHDLNSSCERFGWAYILKSISGVTEADRIAAVSYTHLTLPTILRV